MRRLLISAAALTFMAMPVLVAPALAQHGHRDTDAGAAPPAAQPAPPPQGGGHERGGSDRAMQAPAAATPPPQAADHNGHGHRLGPQMAAPAPQPAPPDHGDRGMAHTNTLPPGWTPPAGTSAQAVPQGRGPGDRDRNSWQNRGGQNNGRDFNRPNNYPGNNFSSRDNRGFGNPGYGGPRHDFRNFHDFHRGFDASRRFRAPYYRRPAGWYDHRWSFGEYLPPAYWARDYWLDDYMAYDLPPPPYGAVWVRVGNDALLVDQDSGEIITIEYGVFY